MAYLQYFISQLTIVSALGGGLFALYKHLEDKKWKRQQFATQLYRDFAGKASTRKAMMMLDWERDIELFPELTPDQRSRHVDGAVLAAALDGPRKFNEVEARVRDIFDEFLTDLAEFEHHIDSELISVDQVKSYLEYWAKLMTGHGHRHAPELWRQLDLFMDTFDYKPVKMLFARFGYEIAMPPADAKPAGT